MAYGPATRRLQLQGQRWNRHKMPHHLPYYAQWAPTWSKAGAFALVSKEARRRKLLAPLEMILLDPSPSLRRAGRMRLAR